MNPVCSVLNALCGVRPPARQPPGLNGTRPSESGTAKRGNVMLNLRAHAVTREMRRGRIDAKPRTTLGAGGATVPWPSSESFSGFAELRSAGRSPNAPVPPLRR